MTNRFLTLLITLLSLSIGKAQSLVDINNSADHGIHFLQESYSTQLQSFIPNTSGNLTAIEVYTQSISTPALTFFESLEQPSPFKIIIYKMPSIYATLPSNGIPDWGNFYTNVRAGDTLLSKNFSRIDIGTTTFTFDSPIALVAGQKYLFAIEQYVDLSVTYSFNSGNYSNGSTAGFWDNYNLAVSGDRDLAFKTYMNTTSVPLTEVRSDYANIVLSEMNNSTILRCNSVPNATDYEWQFTEVSSNTIVCTKRRSANYTNFFLTTSFHNIRYNKTYNVKVRAKVAGNWGTFGPSSTLTTPSATWSSTQLRNDFRNITFITLDNSTLLRCDPILGAIDYEWEFTDISTGTIVRTKKRGASYTNFFLKYYFPQIRMATTYSVKVRALVNGSWGSYGDGYTITTPNTTSRSYFLDKIESDSGEEEMEKVHDLESSNYLDIILSPNPTKDIVNINSNYPIEKITVVNLTGQVILEKNEPNIDLSQFNSGIYFITITTQYGYKVIKVIKD
jgi:hypothetical protein